MPKYAKMVVFYRSSQPRSPNGAERILLPNRASLKRRLFRARVVFGLLGLEGPGLPGLLAGQQLASQQVTLAVVAEEDEVVLAVERLAPGTGLGPSPVPLFRRRSSLENP